MRLKHVNWRLSFLSLVAKSGCIISNPEGSKKASTTPFLVPLRGQNNNSRRAGYRQLDSTSRYRVDKTTKTGREILQLIEALPCEVVLRSNSVICKGCLRLLKKRAGLIRSLQRCEEELRLEWHGQKRKHSIYFEVEPAFFTSTPKKSPAPDAETSKFSRRPPPAPVEFSSICSTKTQPNAASGNINQSDVKVRRRLHDQSVKESLSRKTCSRPHKHI